MYIWYILSYKEFVFNGLMTYFLIFYILKFSIAKSHRKGIQLVKKQMFEQAIISFEESYSYFNKNAWIDKYRFITLLSSSKISYKEMALNNIAFCYGQIGNGKKSKEYYERTLKEFPDSSLAITGLRMINSVKNEE